MNPAINPRELKPDEIVAFGSYFFEVTQLTEHGVRLSTLTSSMVGEGGLLRFEDKQWAEVRRPKGKDLRQIAAIKAKREHNTRMRHTAARLPDGSVHVQNYLPGIYGGLGQHHVHTAENFAAWSKDIDPKYLKVADAKACGCGLEPGQTREYDGKVWRA